MRGLAVDTDCRSESWYESGGYTHEFHFRTVSGLWSTDEGEDRSLAAGIDEDTKLVDRETGGVFPFLIACEALSTVFGAWLVSGLGRDKVLVYETDAARRASTRSLCDGMMRELKERPLRTEGRSGGWILQDYGDVVLHVMRDEQRQFYDLETLWNTMQPNPDNR